MIETPEVRGIAVAGSVSAAIVLALGWPWREPGRVRVGVSAGIGVGVAFLLGCLVMGITPHWPPREDVDRFLLLLLPAVVLVEVLAAVPKVPRYAAWVLRVVLAVAAAPVLLHNTVYLAELAGPGSRAWSAMEATLIVAGLAAALVGAWATLLPLARRPAGRTVPLRLAVVCGGARPPSCFPAISREANSVCRWPRQCGVGIAMLVLREPGNVGARSVLACSASSRCS